VNVLTSLAGTPEHRDIFFIIFGSDQIPSIMKKITSIILVTLAIQVCLIAQENITYQKPTGDILALV
jgi:hypothetical protein